MRQKVRHRRERHKEYEGDSPARGGGEQERHGDRHQSRADKSGKDKSEDGKKLGEERWAGALKEESMECRWGGGTGPQPCRGERRGEEPSQGLHSRFWGWARAQAGDTARDGPITVRMPLA